MLILSEPTPNPDALKFLPQRRLTPGPGWSFRRQDGASGASPLAERLFELDGVERVHVGADFVTVTRSSEGPPWSQLRAEVLMALADHLASGAAHVSVQAPPPVSDDEIETEIREVLDRFVQPGVARDGGQILLERFDPASGVAWVTMEGACGGCPSSRQTLKANVEQILRRYIPEVLRVEAADEAAGETAAERTSRLAERLRAKSAGPGRRIAFSHNGRAYRGEQK